MAIPTIALEIWYVNLTCIFKFVTDGLEILGLGGWELGRPVARQNMPTQAGFVRPGGGHRKLSTLNETAMP